MHVVQLCRQWPWSEASLLDDLTWGLGDAVCHRGQQAAEAREDAHLQSEEVAGTKRKPELEVEDDRTPCVHCDHIPEGLALVYRQECVQTNPPLAAMVRDAVDMAFPWGRMARAGVGVCKMRNRGILATERLVFCDLI